MFSGFRGGLVTALLSTAFVVSTTQAADGDPERGRIAAETCLGCHAIPEYTNAYPTYNVPKVGGQNADYVVAALQAYRDGSRPHATMQANAASLTDQQIADIAAYFASLGQ